MTPTPIRRMTLTAVLGFVLGMAAAGVSAFAASTNAGTMTATRGPATLSPDGSMTVIMYYANATDRTSVSTRVIRIPSLQTSPVVDNNGKTLSATVPAALFNAVATLSTQLDTTINSAAAGGKLDL